MPRAKKLLKPEFQGSLSPYEIRARIQSLCKDNNYDPFLELIELAKGFTEIEVNGEKVRIDKCTVDQKIAIAKEIAPYLAPKLKSMEITGQTDNSLTIEVVMVGSGKSATMQLPGESANAAEVQKVLADRVLEAGNRKKDILGEVIEEGGEDED